MNEPGRINALQLKVNQLERKLDFVMRQLNLQMPEEPVDPATLEIINWLRQGNKIQAITSYRKATGVGLAEAKAAVDAVEKQLGIG